MTRVVGGFSLALLSFAIATPAISAWNQFNDEANRQRQMASMQQTDANNDRRSAVAQRQRNAGGGNSGSGGRGDLISGSGSGSSGSSGDSGLGASGGFTDTKKSVVARSTITIRTYDTPEQIRAALERGANAGVAVDQLALAELLYIEYFGNRDDVTARRWYKAAADQGSVKAQSRYGYFLGMGLGGAKDETEGELWLKRAADGGVTEAEAMLARILIVKPDMPSQLAGVDLCKRAASKDEMICAALLGQMYATGDLVAKDDAESARLLRIAALQGEPGSMSLLASMIEAGRAMPRSGETAAGWMRKSADAGDRIGLGLYALYLVNGSHGVQVDPERAGIYARRAADKGDSFGQLLLGKMYDAGLGVVQDRIEGERLIKASAAQGNTHAIKALAER